MASKKKKREQQRAQLLAVLQALSPVFDSKKPHPLALGISAQLQETLPDASENAISDFLMWWTDRKQYHRAILDGQWRHDLLGNRVIEIDERHRTWSQGRLKFIARKIAEANDRKAVAS